MWTKLILSLLMGNIQMMSQKLRGLIIDSKDTLCKLLDIQTNCKEVISYNHTMKKDDRIACYTINTNGLNIITLGQKAEFNSIICQKTDSEQSY